MATRGRPSKEVERARWLADLHVGAQLADFEAVQFWRTVRPTTLAEAQQIAQGVALGRAWRQWQAQVGQQILERRAGWREDAA